LINHDDAVVGLAVEPTEVAPRAWVLGVIAIAMAVAACRSGEAPSYSPTTQSPPGYLAAQSQAAVGDVIDVVATDASKPDAYEQGVIAPEAITPEVFSREIWASVLARERIRPERALRPKPPNYDDIPSGYECPRAGLPTTFIPMSLEDSRLEMETSDSTTVADPWIVLKMTRRGQQVVRVPIVEVDHPVEGDCPFDRTVHSVGQSLSCGKRSYLAMEFVRDSGGMRSNYYPSLLVVSAPQEGQHGAPRVEGWVPGGYSYNESALHVGVNADVFLDPDCGLRAAAVYGHIGSTDSPGKLSALLSNPRSWRLLAGRSDDCRLGNGPAIESDGVMDEHDDYEAYDPWTSPRTQVLFVSSGPWPKAGGYKEPYDLPFIEWRAVAQTVVVGGYTVEPARTLQEVIGERAKRSCLWGLK
jgi:hypothetical protein